MAAAATARKPAAASTPRARPAPAPKAPPRKPAAPRKPASTRKATATRRAAPARKQAPARRPAPARRHGGQLIPIAVGTASAVRRLPDSGLMVRLTQGRAWIAVLGTLLAGIVALNVITLSFAATAGQIDQNIQALDQENTVLRSRDAQKSATARIRSDAAALGLSASTIDQVGYVQADAGDVAIAAQRLAAAEAAY